MVGKPTSKLEDFFHRPERTVVNGHVSFEPVGQSEQRRGVNRQASQIPKLQDHMRKEAEDFGCAEDL